MLTVTSLDLHTKSQPDFDLLKTRGWEYPPGARAGEVWEGSLIKDCGKFRVQIVRYPLSTTRVDRSFTRIFIRDRTDALRAQLHGHGTPYSVQEAVEVLEWLQRELGPECPCHSITECCPKCYEHTAAYFRYSVTAEADFIHAAKCERCLPR